MHSCCQKRVHGFLPAGALHAPWRAKLRGIGEHGHFFEDILQLAHVAAPGAAAQTRQRVGQELAVRQTGALLDLLEDAFAQRLEVVLDAGS